MRITGKLIKVLPATSGVSSKGPWRRAVAIFEDNGKSFPIVFFNERLSILETIPIGSSCEVSFYIRSWEFLNEWYTQLVCYYINVRV